MNYLVNNAKRFLVTSASALVLFSCSDEAEELINEFEEEQKVSKSELKTIIDTDSVSGVADDLISDLYQNDKAGKSAKTEEGCYVVDYSETGFTLLFDNCEENGEILNGSITVVYGEENGNYAFVVDYEDLMVGDFVIDGTRSFKFNNTEGQEISWTVDSKLDVEMEDGSIVAEEGVKTLGFVFGNEFGSGYITLDGEWILKSEGNTYIVDITDLMEADFGCEHFGKGIMALSKNGLEVTVDFGDGTCDDVAILTYPDDTEEEISLKD